jgi:DNA-binding NarL/FixJ family response regulator
MPSAPTPAQQRAQRPTDGVVVDLRALRPRLAPQHAATVEQRMTALEEQAGELALAVTATRAIMTIVEDRLANVHELQTGVALLRADLDARGNDDDDRRRSDRAPCPLSSRELEVLLGLADGKVYKEIAADLSLSASTVRSHLHHVYVKLGVVDRAQAVLLASSRGWI